MVFQSPVLQRRHGGHREDGGKVADEHAECEAARQHPQYGYETLRECQGDDVSEACSAKIMHD